ncbi:MAG: amidohydrolase [Edaphobacter sp.]
MQARQWMAVCGITAGLTSTAIAQEVPALVDSQLPSLVTTYQQLHRTPELSHFEAKTSEWLAGELRAAGYTVTDHIGRYIDGSPAYGLVGILKNGAGPTLLIRTDMDALPVEEKTGLPYASTVRMKNAAGQEVSVMHACGHDIHMTTMLGVARVMVAKKAKWHGTLMLVGQPAEEVGEGARAMLSDGFYKRFGRPDYAIALHDNASLAAGKVGITSGPAMAGSMTVYVTIRGVGGHGAMPASTKDPIVMASQFVLALQTIVSRQTLPTHPAVVTVGMINGGTQANIIPDEVKLGLSVRFMDETVRKEILADIQRIADGIAMAAGVPPDRRQTVEVVQSRLGAVTYNDPALTARVRSALVAAVGSDNVVDLEPLMVSEDFGSFGLEDRSIPTVLFWIGGVDPAKIASGEPLPSLHSSLWAPKAEPTLRTGVIAMSDTAISLLQ